VDPAGRLLEVAREQAARGKLEADFVKGDAAAIPLADGEADLVLSGVRRDLRDRPRGRRCRDGARDRAGRPHRLQRLDSRWAHLRDRACGSRGRGARA